MVHNINTLPEFRNNSIPLDQVFQIHSQVWDKVAADGKYKPFYGNTVVFQLSNPVKNELCEIQKRLYLAAEDMLAERLHSDTFHMTLHGLCDSPADCLPENFYETMYRYGTQARDLIAKWQNMPPLKMRATCTFNLVNTSIVLGLEPCDIHTEQQLSAMYEELQGVVRFPYPLMPHITLAYYRPGKYTVQHAKKLAGVLGTVKMQFVLPMGDLILQNFLNMNQYISE